VRLDDREVNLGRFCPGCVPLFNVAGSSLAFIGRSAEFQASFLVNANELHCHCADPLTSTRQLLLADWKLIYDGFTAVNVACDAVFFDRYQRIGGYFSHSYNQPGARGGVVFKTLRYKPAGRGFDSLWCHWNFSVTILLVEL
jgi:hypothetical protein